MFKILTVKDTVRVPPVRFDMELENGVKESLQDQVEGKINPDIGVFLAVTDVNDIGEGSIVPEDGAILSNTKY
jgi:DNA-directed RNA polymerase subunit E'